VLRTALFFLLMSIFGVGKMDAQEFTVGDLNYTVNPDGTTVTVTSHVNGTSASGTLDIPETVTYSGMSYTVSSIGDYAFDGCSNLTGSITIPNSVVTIGHYSFYGCRGFNGNLTIPIFVTSIGAAAFANCENLTSIHFNAFHCESMGYVENEHYWYYVFYNNNSLNEIIIGDDVTSIPIYAFANHGSRNCQLVLGNAVETIDESAFYNGGDENHPGLVGELNLPNSVIEINHSAFYGCRGLTGSLTIPNSVTTIGRQAFRGCSGFTGDLTIGNSVTTIDHMAFYGCSGFMGTLTIGNSVDSIGNWAFSSSSFTGSLTIPNSVTTIGQAAFFDCSGFTGSLTIGKSVIFIREWCFNNCSGLTSINVLSEVPPTFSDVIFDNVPCTSLTVPCECKSVYEASDWHDYFPTIIEDCTGLSEDGEDFIKAYPNPTNGQINIEAEGLKHITISNLLGQTIFESKACGDEFTYDLGKHGTGLYLIRIKTANGIAVKKVSVAR
jgi:hypothetical protein